MCTIMTVSKDFYDRNQGLVIQQINDDYVGNPDGLNLVCIDFIEPERNIQFNTMQNTVVPIIDAWFKDASEVSRVFLHQRKATLGLEIGLPYNHGFTDSDGRFIMHNGRINLGKHEAVDSFFLRKLNWTNPKGVLKRLKKSGETYANIFCISEFDFSVIRLHKGTLFTDGKGNYSSHAVGKIKAPVKRYSVKTHTEYYTQDISWREYEEDDPIAVDDYLKDSFLTLEDYRLRRGYNG